MATKIYVESTGSPAISPSFSSLWEHTSSASRRVAALTKGSTAQADETFHGAVSAPSDILIFQAILGPIAAVTISGTIDASFQCKLVNFSALHQLEYNVKIVSSDGLTTRGSSNSTDGTDCPNPSYASRYHSWTPSSIVGQAGDYLVIEVGMACQSIDAYDRYIEVGTSDGSDLDAADGDTLGDGWIQFTETISEIAEPTTLTYTIDPYYGQVNQAAADNAPITDGTGVTYSVTAGSLPTGISLDASTGILSGTPTVAGTYTFTVQVSNSLGSATQEVIYKIGRIGGGWSPNIRL